MVISSGLDECTRVILQARTTSSRLPAKCLLPLGGLPIAVLSAKRISNTGLDVVLATSDEATDDVLVRELERHSINYARGSMDNVLGRFVLATSDLADDDICVRMTADNVFPDGQFVDHLLAEFKARQADYISSADDLPYGLAAEVLRVGELRKAAASTQDAYDVEHVTPFIKRSLTCLKSQMNLGLGDNRDLSCTIDSLADYLRARAIFDTLHEDENATTVAHVDLVKRLVSAERQKQKLEEKHKIIGPPLVFGTVQLGLKYGRLASGDKPTIDTAVDMIHTATNAGVTQFDTARAYGDSEHKIGIARADKLSSNMSVLTKLSPLSDLASNADEKTVRAHVNASVYRSLYELNLKTLPVLCLHRASQLVDFDGFVWDELLSLQKQNLIGKLGTSVQSPEELALALTNAFVKHIQLPFNLLDGRWDKIFDTHKKPKELTIHARSAYLQGLLLCESDELWPNVDGVDAASIISKIGGFVSEFDRLSRHDLCLAFVRSTPWIDGVVVGMDNAEQIRANLALFCEPLLTGKQMREIRDTFADLPESLLNPAQWN